jgi:hypothetical protein
MVGLLASRQVTEGNVRLAPPLNLPAARHASRVRVHEQQRHHHRVVGRLAAFLGVRLQHGAEIQRLAQLDEEARQVPLSQYLSGVLRQQLSLLRLPLPERPWRGEAGGTLQLLPLRLLTGGYFQQGGLLWLLRRGGAHPPPSTRTRLPLEGPPGASPPWPTLYGGILRQAPSTTWLVVSEGWV